MSDMRRVHCSAREMHLERMGPAGRRPAGPRLALPLSASRPRGDAAAKARCRIEGLGPADVLLDFGRQRTDRPFGQMAGACCFEFVRDASDLRQE
jgi:hypothetical protein